LNLDPQRRFGPGIGIVGRDSEANYRLPDTNFSRVG